MVSRWFQTGFKVVSRWFQCGFRAVSKLAAPVSKFAGGSERSLSVKSFWNQFAFPGKVGNYSLG